MGVKAIRLDEAEEQHYKILDAMFDDSRNSVHVNFVELGKKLGVSEDVVRYNMKKLLKLGYIRVRNNGYEPTAKVLYLQKK